MLKRFELWLDESGNFENENDKKRANQSASLVGGLLVEKTEADRVDFDGLVHKGFDHAMNMDGKDKINRVLPALVSMQNEYHAIEVFFENSTYTDMDSSRQLYLYIISEGILQLVQYLNACYESVNLEVYIAHRIDKGVSGIEDREYEMELSRIIKHKKNKQEMILDKDTAISFLVNRAADSKRLQLADFACNTRLTRTAACFKSIETQAILFNLYENALIFTMSEDVTENIVKQMLVQGKLADAIYEFHQHSDFLSNRQKDRTKSIIISNMNNTSYRLLKSQMKALTSKITAYSYYEDDYKSAERYLKSVADELLPIIKKTPAPTIELECNVLLLLADAYLREGDTIHAREALELCVNTHRNAGNALEEVFMCYRILEKRALLEIDEFNFNEASELMGEACSIYSDVMDMLSAEPYLKERFSTMRSEYYGDALCMKIYAMMFLQRENRGIYSELVKLSDIALTQYPLNEGELERHRQYRSHIELEAGRFVEAIRWLALAKEISLTEITSDSLRQFLNNVVETEINTSCQYYAMYYCLIMAEAFRTNDSIASIMHDALIGAERFAEVCGISEISNDFNKINIKLIKETEVSEYYHPMEVVFWKYAYCLAFMGKMDLAAGYYEKAINICYNNKHVYLTMRITGIGICSDYVAGLIRAGADGKLIKDECDKLKNRVQAVLALTKPESPSRKLVEKMLENISMAATEGTFRAEVLENVARYITY